MHAVRLALYTLLVSGAVRAGPIQHVVVVMMENRSFDHFLGWAPGSDGQQAGLAYPDRTGGMRSTYPLAPDYQGCAHPDPDHSYVGGRVEFDGGKCDGWLLAGANDIYAIGYYTENDLAFFGQAVPRWTLLDRYFAAMMSETYPNRIYQHAAQTDRITNTTQVSTLPTIWDRLAEHGRIGRYYYSDVPFLALWGAKYVPISRPVTEFLADAAAGNLPDVAFVDPRFTDESSGTSADDHPHADIRAGEAFINLIYSAVVKSPQFGSTVLVINYDEWGGFYDHVPPPTAPIPPITAAAGDTDGRLGFRTANLLVAPWARRAVVVHEQFDHTSVLKMIENAFGLEPLTVRDGTANDLADALDFNHFDATAPLFEVPPVFAGACAGAVSAGGDLANLIPLARQSGFPVPAASGSGEDETGDGNEGRRHPSEGRHGRHRSAPRHDGGD